MGTNLFVLLLNIVNNCLAGFPYITVNIFYVGVSYLYYSWISIIFNRY